MLLVATRIHNLNRGLNELAVQVSNLKFTSGMESISGVLTRLTRSLVGTYVFFIILNKIIS